MGRWTEEDTARLVELRSKGESWAAIEEDFPGRTSDAVRARYLRVTGITRTKTVWTKEDHQRLMDLKNSGASWKDILASFPGRTLSAMHTRWTRAKEGPRKVYTDWTQEEDARLVELKESGKMLRDNVAAFPGRTLRAIYRRYGLIGPRGKTGRLLHSNTGGFNDADRQKIFTLHENGMTPTQIHTQFFSEKPIDMVRNCIKLGLRADELGDKSRYRHPWTRSDDKKILHMRHNEHKTFKDIAAEIGRSYLSTTNRYYALTEGTIRPSVPKRNYYTPEEKAKIAQMLKMKIPIKQIAAAIGRTPVGVFHKVFANRAEMGYIKPAAPSWHERKVAAGKIEKLRNLGMQWKEVQAHLPEYTHGQLKTFHRQAKAEAMESNWPKSKKPHSESELQALATKVRRYFARGMSWKEVGLKFPNYSLNRVRALYIEANSGQDARFTLRRPPTARRSSREVDVDMIEEYRAKGMTWKEVQAHMPDWSVGTLQRAYGRREPTLRTLGTTEVRKIAKYKQQKMTWVEIQAHMPEYSLSRLQRAYAQGRKNRIV